MSRHRARVAWRLGEGEDFPAGRYSRGHAVGFEGGVEVPGTASRHVVGSRWAAEGAVDPEEMFTAAVAACHMLSFLHAARLEGFVVQAYEDEGVGEMAETAPGRRAVVRVRLSPRILWAGDPPDAQALGRLHAAAHEACFIANSIRTEVVVAASPPAGSEAAR